jgi:uncharacterized protein with PQ loop repeat
MLPHDARAVCVDDRGKPPTGFQRFLRWMAAGTMLMTIPQGISVWKGGDPGSVSLVSWLAYLGSSIAWLVYGIRKRDPTIWIVCVGWILVDGAIVIGILVKG